MNLREYRRVRKALHHLQDAASYLLWVSDATKDAALANRASMSHIQVAKAIAYIEATIITCDNTHPAGADLVKG